MLSLHCLGGFHWHGRNVIGVSSSLDNIGHGCDGCISNSVCVCVRERERERDDVL